ncbi:MAG TPA: acetate--CoA ligase family protein [Stellaceae bacterium]|nr:acetate--CoA ligase family protein [Stellaceae bacterium]
MTERAPARLSIRQILHPRSVAVFGASDNADKFGGRIMRFLTRHGFPGRIVPINPRRSEVLGHRAYATIAEAPGEVDVAILAVPPGQLVGAVADCAAAGIGCCVVMTTGFAEASEEGAARQDELAAIARRSGMRIVGPNCMGFLNPAWKLTLCSSVVLEAERLLVGEIGLVSQSGALMVSMFDRAYGDGIGFSACVSLGNQSDLELCDFLEYFIEDPATRVVCLYVEGFVDPARFVRAAAACRAAGKPLIVLKTGRTPAGVKAARSHTASLAGAYDIFRAVCREHGVLLVDDPAIMVRLADLLARWPEAGGDGIGVLSGSGGSAGILADRLSEAGLRLATLAPTTRARLSEILLPPQADNPIDLGGRRPPESVEIAGTAMSALAADPDVAVIVMGLSSMPFFENRTRLLATAAMASGKPVLCSLLPGPAADRPRAALREAGCPFFDSTEEQLRTLGHFMAYRRLAAYGAEPAVRPASLSPQPVPLPGGAGHREIGTLLAAYGLPLAREILAKDSDEAVAAASSIGYPVALKGVTRDLVHKSDAGAVKLNLRDEAALRAAWEEIMRALARSRSDAAQPANGIEGCIVQEMVEGGAELILGIKRDPQFGPVVLVGSGGILVELLRDVELAPAPLSHAAALRLLRRLRSAPILDGIRGQPPLDLDAAADAVVRLGWLAADLGARLVDLEINPLVLRRRGRGAVAVDFRATLLPGG